MDTNRFAPIYALSRRISLLMMACLSFAHADSLPIHGLEDLRGNWVLAAERCTSDSTIKLTPPTGNYEDDWEIDPSRSRVILRQYLGVQKEGLNCELTGAGQAKVTVAGDQLTFPVDGGFKIDSKLCPVERGELIDGKIEAKLKWEKFENRIDINHGKTVVRFSLEMINGQAMLVEDQPTLNCYDENNQIKAEGHIQLIFSQPPTV